MLVGAGAGGEEGRDPGYVNEMWATIEQPGTYRGVCASCAVAITLHAIVVKAVTPAEFDAWIKAKGGTVKVASAERCSRVENPAAAPAPQPATAAPAAAAPAAAAPAAAAPSSRSQLPRLPQRPRRRRARPI